MNQSFQEYIEMNKLLSELDFRKDEVNHHQEFIEANQKINMNIDEARRNQMKEISDKFKASHPNFNPHEIKTPIIEKEPKTRAEKAAAIRAEQSFKKI